MAVKEILKGHDSPDTAYLVADYPYGFRLRCQMRYYLEATKHGERLVSQTTNPKKAGIVWNKPKASTYAPIAACMYLDENNHVQWAGLNEYSDLEEAEKFFVTYKDGLSKQGTARAEQWIEAKRQMIRNNMNRP